MPQKKDKYANFRQSPEMYERIGIIQTLLENQLRMSVSRSYVVRLVLEEGLRALERTKFDQ